MWSLQNPELRFPVATTQGQVSIFALYNGSVSSWTLVQTEAASHSHIRNLFGQIANQI